MIRNFTDHSANERTFLAWVRTAVSIVGFGFAAARLGKGQSVLWSEMLLLSAGAVVACVAYLRMRKLKREIELNVEIDDASTAADTMLLALIASLFGLLAVFAFHVS